MQTRAQISCTLLTRQSWQGETVTRVAMGTNRLWLDKYIRTQHRDDTESRREADQRGGGTAKTSRSQPFIDDGRRRSRGECPDA